MQLLRILQILPLVATASGLVARDEDQAPVEGQITNTYIVEVENASDVDALSKKLTQGKSAKVVKTYKSDVFSGLAIETEDDTIDTLNELAEVSHAWISHLVELPEPINLNTVQISDITRNYSTTLHSQTGVGEAHARGNFGQGIKVAIVDTGIDYNHEALGAGFGPGFKVSGGWDFVGDDWRPPSQNFSPGPDPIDVRGHGTMVSGIVAGKNEWYSGVAPEAEILAYKVFGRADGTEEAVLIDSFIRAYEDGADVISASIGGHMGWANGPWAAVASRIADKGVIVTISASNSGEFGPFFASSGSSGESVISVASAHSNTLLADATFELIVDQDGEETAAPIAISFNLDRRWTHENVEIVPLTLNTTWERQGCSNAEVPDDLPDMTDKIVLVRRGGCAYNPKVGHIRDVLQPLGIMFYNPDEFRASRPFSDLSSVPISLVEWNAGKAIIDAVAAGATVTGNFAKYLDVEWYSGIYNGAGGRPSAFTSWGGLFDMQSKPDVAAPGSDILMPDLDNTWDIGSGTSMSAPYIAGIAALFLNQHGGRDVHGPGVSREFFNRVVSSGSALKWSTRDLLEPVDTGYWAPPLQVGTGAVDAWKVLDYTTTLSTAKFALNDTANFQGEQSVDITNSADVDVQYVFQLQPAAGILAGAVSTQHVERLTNIVPTTMVPGFEGPSGTFTVAAGSTRKADFTFEYPTGFDASRQPFYSGKILITSSLGEVLSISYMGAAFDLKAHFTDIWSVPVLMRSSGTLIENKAELTFDLATRDWFWVMFKFAWGCDEVRWDIYESGWQESQWEYPPVVGEAGYIGSATTWADSGRGPLFNPAINDHENTIAFPLNGFGRDYAPTRFGAQGGYYIQDWFGKLANGTYLPPGTYTMRFAALRPLGTRENAADWDVHETPEFTVLPAP